jgi:hypothetical protein
VIRLFSGLVVVWHYYIRQSGILDRLSETAAAPPTASKSGRSLP